MFAAAASPTLLSEEGEEEDERRPISTLGNGEPCAHARTNTADGSAAQRAGRALVVADIVRQNVADVQVNDPVHEVETDEANGEHHSGVLVDIGRADAK